VSLPVSLERLRQEVDRYQPVAYLLTVAPDGRPHSVALMPAWSGDELVMAPGNSSVANAQASPLVSLLWPPAEPGGYSLIVDATVTSASGGGHGDNALSVRPTNAVLHRPAAASDGSAGGSDCVRVYSNPA
jgi:pyridoxamine 5'-phosphate oxidase-like protein